MEVIKKSKKALIGTITVGLGFIFGFGAHFFAIGSNFFQSLTQNGSTQEQTSQTNNRISKAISGGFFSTNQASAETSSCGCNCSH